MNGCSPEIDAWESLARRVFNELGTSHPNFDCQITSAYPDPRLAGS
jgi:hypothetical protein